jgi:tRNA pseudouridine55 synthase
MHGLLVVDKPAGLTSHDVVARLRRVLREKAIGHTGTLDPMATGLMLLLLGKATRLARFLTDSRKSYDAVVRLGFATDTADALGQPIGSIVDGPWPSRETIDAALEAFRGTFMQQPPAFSAKKIDGQRSYKLARKRAAAPAAPAAPALPAPCSVTTTRLEIVGIEAETVTLRVDCSAGFYVRSLAHDLGERLGVGGHLVALRRTNTGGFGLDQAITLDAAERDPERAAAAVIPLAGMLLEVAAVVLTAEGINHVIHGRDIDPRSASVAEPAALSPQPSLQPSALSLQPFVRLLDPAGELIAIARRTGSGALHPSVVLV